MSCYIYIAYRVYIIYIYIYYIYYILYIIYIYRYSLKKEPHKVFGSGRLFQVSRQALLHILRVCKFVEHVYCVVYLCVLNSADNFSFLSSRKPVCAQAVHMQYHIVCLCYSWCLAHRSQICARPFKKPVRAEFSTMHNLAVFINASQCQIPHALLLGSPYGGWHIMKNAPIWCLAYFLWFSWIFKLMGVRTNGVQDCFTSHGCGWRTDSPKIEVRFGKIWAYEAKQGTANTTPMYSNAMDRTGAHVGVNKIRIYGHGVSMSVFGVGGPIIWNSYLLLWTLGTLSHNYAPRIAISHRPSQQNPTTAQRAMPSRSIHLDMRHYCNADLVWKPLVFACFRNNNLGFL